MSYLLQDLLESLVIPFLIFLCFFAVVGGVFFVALNFYGKYTCGNFSEITGKETRWAAFDSCYINAENGWERWDIYEKRAMASEGLKAIAK